MSLGRLLLYFMTAMSFVFAAYAILVEAPPVWVPVVYFVMYAGLIVWGVMNLRLRMFGDAICAAPEAGARVALTFDDGPDPVTTRETLRILRDSGVRATFFVLGSKAEKYPEVLREIAADGHVLGLHSYAHPRLYSLLPPRVVQDDIERCRSIIERATGKRPIWFRPPVGQMSPRTARGVELADAVVLGWSVRGLDGLEQTTEGQCYERVASGLRGGAIVLLHDAWERREVPEGSDPYASAPAGVRALERIIRTCRERDLHPVTVTELLEPVIAGPREGRQSAES